jgi:hypothetical protein
VKIISASPSGFVIIHAGRIIDKDFATKAEAEAWADANIDDQMFDKPNWFADPIKYRAAQDSA